MDQSMAAKQLFSSMKDPNEDPASAMKTLRRCMDLDPTDGEYPSTLGMLLARFGDLDEALKLAIRGTELGADTAVYWDHLGLVHIHRRSPKDAAQAFAIAINLDPGPARFHYNLGTAHLLAQEYQAAQTGFNGAIDRDKTYKDAYHNLAVCQSKSEDFEGALQTLAKALDLDPDDGITHLQMGRLQLRHGDAQLALNHLVTACRLEPENALAHFFCGQAHATLEQTEEAIESMVICLKIAPKQFAAWSNLIALLLDAGDESALDEALEGCLTAMPGAITHYNLGALFANLDRIPDAQKQMRAALAMEPENPAYQQAVKHLESLQSTP